MLTGLGLLLKNFNPGCLTFVSKSAGSCSQSDRYHKFAPCFSAKNTQRGQNLSSAANTFLSFSVTCLTSSGGGEFCSCNCFALSIATSASLDLAFSNSKIGMLTRSKHRHHRIKRLFPLGLLCLAPISRMNQRIFILVKSGF